MEPCHYFSSIQEELGYLRGRIETTYRNASVRPENCADAKNLLKGIRDDLKPYYDSLQHRKREDFFRKGTP